ncbi:MAG: response regulator [Ferruginibacter sp.]|nr:response regulator [Cytophagales bacterium]
MKKTILIVDDSESVREVVKFTLEQAGYQVIAGVDGKDALRYLTGETLHLVLTDLHMPHLDGIGLIREIRAREAYRYLPILLLTTESQAAKKQEAKEAGATGWIVKPFVQEKLLEVVQKVIR